MRYLLPLFFVAVLPACAKLWKSSPPGEEIPVEELARALVCNTGSAEPEVHVFADLGTVQAWAAGRGFKLAPNTTKPLADSPYAVVELGQRDHSGYSIVVSKKARVHQGELFLEATFFELQPERWVSADPSSPCVAVSLPPGRYVTVKVVDQTGVVRAATDGQQGG